MIDGTTGNWTGGTFARGTSSASVHEYAAAQGWVLVNEIPRTITGPRCWVWRADDGEASLIEDHCAGLRHLEARPAAFAERLVKELRLERYPELADRARTAPDSLERARALNAMDFQQHGAALKAAENAPGDPDHPGYALLPDDALFLETFERALDDPKPCVRRAGMTALAYSLWPGSRDILRRRHADLPQFTELIEKRLKAEPDRISKS